MTTSFGQEDYRAGNGGFDDEGSPVLYVQIGNRRVIYLSKAMKAKQWTHLALVRKGDTVSLFVGGVKQTPVRIIDAEHDKTQHAPELSLAGVTGLPSGTLRFGRRTSGATDSTEGGQAYGIIDDVAVFTRALSAQQIKNIIKQKRLTGKEADLLAGFSFESAASGKSLPAKLDNAWTHPPRTYHTPVSNGRNDASDALVFMNPLIIGVVSTSIQLPFEKNQVWRVVQGMDSPGGSHNGYAAFSYDFVRVDATTGGTKVYAAGRGKLAYYRKSGPSPKDENEVYKVALRVGEDEYISHQHLAKDSISDKVKGGACDSDYLCVVPAKDAPIIQQGAYIARVGAVAQHLHFSGHGVFEAAPSIPVAFDNYWASDDGGKTWMHMLRGHPKAGQYVKRIQ